MSATIERNVRRAWLAFLWASRGARSLVPRPQIAQIEITNRCNLACRTCTRLKLPDLGDMPYEEFCRIVEGLKPLRGLWLSGQGEPLLHPDLPRMVRFCKEQGIDSTVVHTSGMLLRGRVARELAESGLGELRVSIDGGSAEEMEYLREGASLEQVLENTGAFVALGKVPTSFYTVLNRRSHTSVPRLPALAASVGVGAITMVETVPFRDESTEREIYDRREYQFTSLPREVQRKTLAELRREGRRHGVEVQIDLKWYRKRCFDPFHKIYIDVRGNVTPCCRIHNEVFVGNILHDGIERSWFGPEMDRWRADLLRHDRNRRICIERCNLGLGREHRRDP